jgi:hypothetical protein
MNDKVKLINKIGTCIGIMMSSIFISFIPFVLLISYYGFQNKFYLVPITGFIVGGLWSIKVIKRGNYNDYHRMKLYQSPDIIETWEKEENRNKKQEENNKQFDNLNNE